MPTPRRFDDLRREMVENQLRAHGIHDERVLDAMGRVPREAFAPHEAAEEAYADHPLSIGGGRTISQPFVVAFALAAAKVGADEDVLDIGTGSGYSAAVTSLLARRVWTIERDAALALTAAERLRRLGYTNIRVAAGDGTRGWPAHAPYAAIVSAAASFDAPKRWLAQLADKGRLVAPLGPPDAQHLVRITRSDKRLVREKLIPVRYVPLISGDGGDDLVELP